LIRRGIEHIIQARKKEIAPRAIRSSVSFTKKEVK